MMNLADIFQVSEKENLWIVDNTNTLIQDNPFHIIKDKVFDTEERLRDDILGRLVRKDILISKSNLINLSLNQSYFFLNEKLEIKHRRNKRTLIDMFNIMIGNTFIEEKAIQEEEIKRIKSIYFMFNSEHSNMFPYPIVDSHDFFEKIKNMNCLEKDKKSIIDAGAIDKKNYNGTLQRIFEKKNTEQPACPNNYWDKPPEFL